MQHRSVLPIVGAAYGTVPACQTGAAVAPRRSGRHAGAAHLPRDKRPRERRPVIREGHSWISNCATRSPSSPGRASASASPSRKGWRRRASTLSSPPGRRAASRWRPRRSPQAHGVKTIAVACDVGTAEGTQKLIAGIERRFRRLRHPRQQCRHRLERDDRRGAGREVAGLLGPACDGGGAAGARRRALHAKARRRRRS